jgi:Ca2+-binding RTX toxin-like protein
MHLNDRFVPLFAKIRQLEFGRKISGKMRALGLGGIIGTTVCGYPISQVMAYGWDQWGRSWNQQSYHIWNFFSDVKPDVVILYSCDWTTAGNVVTLHNQENAGDTNARIDARMQVSSVQFDDKIYEIAPAVGSVVIKAQFGTIIFFRSGFYSYISHQKQVEDYHSEDFFVNLTGFEGVRETVELTVRAYRVTRTANKMADYGNQVDGQNQSVGGHEAYETRLAGGAMVYGWTNNDVLKGSQSSDALFGWEGNDTIYGLDGDDLIMGEMGSNHLYGGRGADVFALHSGKANNNTVFDTIHDFSIIDGDVLSISSVVSSEQANAYREQQLSGAQSLLRFSIESDYLDVLVNGDGVGQDFFLVARIMKNPNFDPMEASLTDFLRQGRIQF